VFVDVKDAAGGVVNWKVEWMPALVIFPQGFTRDSLHAGDTINMTACLAKDGSHNAAAQFVTVPSAFENHRIGTCKAVSR
jgi:D-aminopeptidase